MDVSEVRLVGVCTHEGDTERAVSYTHLDVYKRQVLVDSIFDYI